MAYSKRPAPGQTTMSASEPVVIASDQSAVPISGTVTANTGLSQPLTDTQLRASAVPVSGTFYQATQPVSGTVTVTATDLDTRNLTATDVVTVTGGAGQTADVKVTLDGESVPVTGTFYQATQPISEAPTAISATAVDASASGDNTIVSITNSPRLYYISLSANGANSADVTATVRVGATTKYKVSLKAGSIWARNVGAGRNYITGNAGDDIIVNLSGAQTVHVSVEYADV